MGSWAHRKLSAATAEKLLAQAPESPTGHGVAVPFPFENRAAYKAKHTNKEINARIETAPIEDVRLDEIHAIQHSVKPNRVAEYIHHDGGRQLGEKHPAAGTPVDQPIVIVSGGKKYLHDGHHRATAAALRGEKTVKARVVDFDQKN